MTTESSNKSNTGLIIILMILAAIAVFAMGILLAKLLGGDQATPPPVTLPTPAPGVPTAVSTDYLNVRSGPSVQYPIYGIAPPGSSAEIVGVSEDGEWWVVKLPTELVGAGQGWVSAQYTRASDAENVPVMPAPPLEEINIPTPQPGAPTAEALAAINVRSGPGTDYTSYGVAAEGMRFEVIGVSADGGWRWSISRPNM